LIEVGMVARLDFFSIERLLFRHFEAQADLKALK
jgi:hypothetical protein